MEKKVQINAIPDTIETFLKLRDDITADPEGAAVMMVLALLHYTRDEDLGKKCLAAAVHSGSLWDGYEGYEGKQLSRGSLQLIASQLRGEAYTIHAYFQGTNPDNGYSIPDPPNTFTFFTNKYSGDPAEGRVKLFIACSGADTPRPISVKLEEDGSWRTAEWSSLIVGIRPPK